MTICIAAIAENGKHIVCATDTLISSGLTTHDPMQLKLSWIKDWTALWAGTVSLQTDLENTFCDIFSHKAGNEPQEVKEALQVALHAELANFSTARYLAPYSISMEMFMKEKDRFTPERWNDISRQIVDYADNYDPAMIVAGWGKSEQENDRWSGPRPSLFLVDRNGVTNRTKEAFCVIGSGDSAAHATMCFYDYNRDFSLSMAVYCVSAAAFMARRSIGVGDLGAIWVASQKGLDEGFFIQKSEIRKIHDEWLKLMPAGIPDSTNKQIASIIESSRTKTT